MAQSISNYGSMSGGSGGAGHPGYVSLYQQENQQAAMQQYHSQTSNYHAWERLTDAELRGVTHDEPNLLLLLETP